MTGKEVISADDYILKLKAAVDARRSKDFIIVARTDARAPIGLDEAIHRGNAYRNAGADVVFVEAPKTREELERIGKSIDAPLVANMIEGGVTPNLKASELLKIGFRIAVFPLSALYGAAFAMREILTELKKTGATEKTKSMMLPFRDFNNLVDLDSYMKLEKRYES